MSTKAINEIVTTALSQLHPLGDQSPITDSEVLDTIWCTQCGFEWKRVCKFARSTPARRAGICENCDKNERRYDYAVKCPKLYRSTDPEKLPEKQWRQVKQWVYGPQGLLLVGETGLGKTRCAWKLIERLFVDDKVEFLAFDAVSFGHAVASKFRADTGEQWIEQVAIAKLVFFDDLGKIKLTERAEMELFGVIERRAANMLPIIATTNDTGDSLAARMTENRGPAMIRRLREFSTVITF